MGEYVCALVVVGAQLGSLVDMDALGCLAVYLPTYLPRTMPVSSTDK